MIGGTVILKCSKEDFEKLEKKVSAHYYKKSPFGINLIVTYDDELEGVIFEYESNLVDFWNRENRRELLDQIEDWFALGEVIEMNEWWVDESREDKIDARKKWAKDNTKTIENWRKFYRKAKKVISF